MASDVEHHMIGPYDRGLEHVHRWKTECSCSWVGVPRRRKREAVQLWRDHKAGITTKKRKGAAGELPARREPTPPDRLPPELA